MSPVPSSPPQFASILVIKLGALGDVLLSVDAFARVRAAFPEARISLLTRAAFVPLTTAMPWFDAVITDLAPKAWQWSRGIRLMRRLRALAPDLVVDLQGNDRTALYLATLRRYVPQVIRASKPFPSLPVPARHAGLLDRAGIPPASAADLAWLDAELPPDLDLPARFAMLIPGCAPQHPVKRWPPSHFAELANMLAAAGIASVAVGTKVDQTAVAEIQRLHPQLLDLTDRTTMFQLARIARRAQLVVGNDTGPVHLAALVGTPTLVLMSRVTDPVRMLPHGPQVSFLKENDLADLSPEAVWHAVTPQLEATR